jgi:small subunit ribosomal protein S11
MAKSKKVTKKRIVVIEPVGQAHINATFNNIIVTLTNNNDDFPLFQMSLN